jgi:hypothetical protein
MEKNTAGQRDMRSENTAQNVNVFFIEKVKKKISKDIFWTGQMKHRVLP